VVFAIPAGAAIWLSANVTIGGTSVAEHIIGGLDPFGLLVGMNGVILLAYVVAIPANEIVVPTILMLTVLVTGDPSGPGAGIMFEGSTAEVEELLVGAGWTLLTAVNVMLFSLLHNPCSTTLYTIYRETGSWKWTGVAAALPLAMGFSLTFVLTQVVRWIGGA
jgi:ferrous iron transport protein B